MAKFNGFNGDYQGLTTKEAQQLQQKYGLNQLTSEKKVTLFSKIIGIFKEPMFLLLFCTALIYFILGEARDGIIMICFVAFMASINFIQEWRTDKTLQALKELSAPRVRVIRDNKIESIESIDLTVGDLMLLEEGEKISADAQIIEMFDLGVDESTLTGESEIVWKRISLDDTEKDAHWRKDYCYSGTTVTQGSAIAKVIAIGVNTEYGKIGVDILSVPEHPTPLEKQTRHLIKVCALIGIILFILVSLVTFIHSNSIVESILSGITLAMAMIPEEFPVILTVFLAMGAWRLAKKNSLIRRMPSVETLGSVSVLCVDKTGTLTKNQMTVQELYGFEENDKREIIYWASLGCETEPYDPMEKAILEHAQINGLSKDEIFSRPLLHEYSFSSETKMMGHIWQSDNKTSSLAAKGSPESILPLCNLNKEELNVVSNAQNKLASKGYRVIAVAKRINLPTDNFPGKLQDNELQLVGLIGLQDPPRESVPEAIKVCSKAGIRVVMITGDNGVTAKSIASGIGIMCSENVITGQELETMSDEELSERVKTTNIFARVIPRHKMRIVKALKDNGEIVAMTGDGVNDAPALKYADIGISMGKRGTGVAKESADMILLDDNFSTIVDTIKDGRRIYDNIRKAVGYVFVIHIPIALLALLTPLLHMPLVLLPIHVVLLELIIDPTCSIIFERQPAENDIMDRKPRLSKAPLITSDLVVKSVLQGLFIFAAAFGSYAYFYYTGAGEAVGRTFALIVLGFANLFLVYVNQSIKGSAILSMFKFKDKVVWYVNLSIIAALLLVTYLPAVNNIAQTSPLNAANIFCAIGIAAVSTFWWELIKVIRNRRISNKSEKQYGQGVDIK